MLFIVFVLSLFETTFVILMLFVLVKMKFRFGNVCFWGDIYSDALSTKNF